MSVLAAVPLRAFYSFSPVPTTSMSEKFKAAKSGANQMNAANRMHRFSDRLSPLFCSRKSAGGALNISAAAAFMNNDKMTALVI